MVPSNGLTSLAKLPNKIMRKLCFGIIPLAGRLIGVGVKSVPPNLCPLFSNSRVCSLRFYQCIFNRGKSRTAHETVQLSYSEYWDPNSMGPGGHPILMTHGLLGSKQNWNSIARAITRATGRKVITFDARNHGESPHVPKHSYNFISDDILSFADTLGLEKFSLLGHSMGGRAVMTFGLLHPERLEKLIVVDVSPLSMSGAFERMSGFIQALMSIKVDSTMTMSEGRKLADQELTAVTDDPALRAFLLTNLAKTDYRGFYWKSTLPVLLDNLAELQDFPTGLLGRQLHIPTRFICGGNSHYVPVSDYKGIRKIFPQAEFSVIPDSGHWPQADNPNQFIPLLINFLTDG